MLYVLYSIKINLHTFNFITHIFLCTTTKNLKKKNGEQFMKRIKIKSNYKKKTKRANPMAKK